MRHIGLVLLVAFAGGNAWADDCRSSFGLEGGLRIEYESGVAETFVKRGNGVVEATGFRSNGTRFERRVAVGGIFETSYEEFEATGENSIYSVELSYSFPVDDYIPPTNWKFVRGTQTEVNDEGYTHRSRYKLEVGAKRTIVINGCMFNWWEMEFTYGFWWDHETDNAMYFPDLGILLRVDFEVPYNLELVRTGKILPLS